jgi:lysozyme
VSDTNNIPLDTQVTKINPKGRGGWVAVAVALIVTWEGFAPTGYHDRIDPPGVNTIGYGHIEDVQIGDKITKVQAGVLLSKDLPRYEKQVERCIKVPMPGYRHAAIISFTYNVGGGALCKSSVARYINAGEWQKGCDALLLYDKANGRWIQGLENRRKAERKLCYNVNEPPIPADEVMVQDHVNVDQATADKEAAAVTIVPKQEQPITVAPAPKRNGIVDWFMEK